MPKVPALPYIRAGVTEGLSANESYHRYQAAARELSDQTDQRWTASNRSTFLQQYSAIRVSRGEIPRAMGAPKDIAFGGLTPVRREATRPGAYLYAGSAFTREPGSTDIEKTIHLIHSTRELTPEQVEDRIHDQIMESATDAHGTFAGMVIEGIVFTGVELLIPEGSA